MSAIAALIALGTLILGFLGWRLKVKTQEFDEVVRSYEERTREAERVTEVVRELLPDLEVYARIVSSVERADRLAKEINEILKRAPMDTHLQEVVNDLDRITDEDEEIQRAHALLEGWQSVIDGIRSIPDETPIADIERFRRVNDAFLARHGRQLRQIADGAEAQVIKLERIKSAAASITEVLRRAHDSSPDSDPTSDG